MMATKGWSETDWSYLAIFPSLLLRMLHNQVWISLARFQNARSKHRIVDKSIEFEQVDRERNWDDQILLNGWLLYLGHTFVPGGSNLPLWRTDGAVITVLLHMGPVEFLYYWFHRALHHHYLYSRYHSHHHASIIVEPITWKERLLYNVVTLPRTMPSSSPPGQGGLQALLMKVPMAVHMKA
ncbi:putative very-long-chain aldehyde decarbonylase GL1-6-like [Cocos nucifera]|nr:putative very-long-chain aldehyde decarbonylase GL1-6-like [Cocos nucifera]